MVLCPIALAVHCSGCPLVKFCPAKTLIGDYGKEHPKKTDEEKGESSDKDLDK